MPKKVLAYVRVSSKRQEDNDNSIPYQKRVISEYAAREGLQIMQWYEETHSAYRGKRGQFRRMLEALDAPGIDGVILHKLDRLSRNVGDFALVDKMMAMGKEFIVIEGRFDTRRAAGRLALRNLCNMCVWYSENLSEEVSAKLGECLRRGYYPGPAPIGYRSGTNADPDRKKKYPHPEQAPLVVEAFRLMATGNWSVRTAAKAMRRKGLLNSAGNPITKSAFHRMLGNPFPCGLIRWTPSSTGEPRLFKGNHEPLIEKSLFDRVQAVLEDRLAPSKQKRDHPYAKVVRCRCGRYLIPSMHKGLTYMACQHKECPFTSIRESELEDHFVTALARLGTNAEFIRLAQEAALRLAETSSERRKAQQKKLNLQLSRLRGKMAKLDDAVLEGYFSPTEAAKKKDDLQSREAELLVELAQVEGKGGSTKKNGGKVKTTTNSDADSVVVLLEGLHALPTLYRSLDPMDRRQIALSLFAKREIRSEGLFAEPLPVFARLADAQAAARTVRGLSDVPPIASPAHGQAVPITENPGCPSRIDASGSDRSSIASKRQEKPVPAEAEASRSEHVPSGGPDETALAILADRVQALIDEAVEGLIVFLRLQEGVALAELVSPRPR